MFGRIWKRLALMQQRGGFHALMKLVTQKGRDRIVKTMAERYTTFLQSFL